MNKFIIALNIGFYYIRFMMFISLVSGSAHSVFPAESYQPQLLDPLFEPYRWQKINELTGKGYRCMTEGLDDLMWFGIEDGIVSYNGIEWKSYSNEDGVEGSIHTLCTAPDSSIYASNGKKIFRFCKNRWQQIFPIEKSLNWEIRKLTYSKDGYLWASLNHGFLRVDQDRIHFYSSKITVDSLKEIVPHIQYHVIPESILGKNRFEGYQILATDQGEVLINCNLGIIKLTYDDIEGEIPLTWKILGDFKKTQHRNISNRILLSSKNHIWYLLDDGRISYFKDNSWITLDLQAQFGGGDVSFSIIEAQDGSIWKGGHGEIFIFKNGEWNTYFTPEIPIPSSSYTDLYAASDGSIWIAGYRNDVLRFDYTSKRWHALNNLNFHCETADKKKWFITKEGKIVTSSPTQNDWISFSVEDGLIDNPVTLYCTQNGQLWAAGSQGKAAAVSYFNQSKWITKTFPQLSWGIDYRAVRETSEGFILFGACTDLLYDQGHRGGIMQYNPSSGDVTNPLAWQNMRPPAPEDAYGIAQTSDDLIWFGRDSLRIFKWNVETNRLEKVYVKIPYNIGNRVDYVHQTPERHLWIGSRNYGLYFYNGEQWSHYHVENGLISNTVIAVYQLADKTVLLSTDKGISRFDGKSWSDYQFPKAFNIAWESGEFRQSNDDAIWINKSSRGWKRRAHDRDFYNPEKQEYWTIRYLPETQPPNTMITLHEEKVSRSGNTILAWTGTDPWNITSQEDLLYSYRMDEGEWSPYSTETKYIFLQLKSGRHRFEVRARDRDFNVDPSPAAVQFKVLPPLWKQPWFLGLILILTITMYSTLRTYSIRKRNKELSQMNEALNNQINERRKVESALKKSEEKYRELYNEAPVGYHELDLDGIIVKVNQAESKMLGYTSDEMIGRSIFDFVEKNEQNIAGKHFHKKITQQCSLRPFERKYVCKNGKIINVYLEESLVFDDKGTCIGIRTTIQDITKRKQAEEQIQKDLKEKEILLGEIHHRVKNNLQIVSSLMNLQSGQIHNEEANATFEKCKNRIHTIALVHEQLYQSKDFSNINAKNYFQTLIQRLRNILYTENRIQIKLNFEEISLGIRVAIPVGLITTELITNSIKYAFPNSQKGILNISFRKHNNRNYELAITDNGVGMPEKFNLEESKSLGLQIVKMLTEQIGGSIQIKSGKGTAFIIQFPQ